MSKNVFGQKAEKVPIWFLDAVIITGIAAMAILVVLAMR